MKASRTIKTFDVDELSMVVSGAADVGTAEFLCLAQDATAVVVSEAVKVGGFSRASFEEVGKELLGILFSCRLSGCLRSGFHDFMRGAMKLVGAGMDEIPTKLSGQSVDSEISDLNRLTVLDLTDRSVLFKPPQWEVYGQHVDRQLSDFVKVCFGNAPIFYNAHHNFGFLHRLDVPSSGLILVAKSYEAFYDLQVQLHAGVMHRDYAVLCHGRLPSTLTEITARLQPTEDGPTLAGRGKISFSKLQCKSICLDPGATGALSHVLLAIDTGRKHQIRSHLAHVGHPVVRDRLYTSLDTFKKDALLSARNWLHRYRLIFQDSTGEEHEVLSELPQDLQLPTSMKNASTKSGGSKKDATCML